MPQHGHFIAMSVIAGVLEHSREEISKYWMRRMYLISNNCWGLAVLSTKMHSIWRGITEIGWGNTEEIVALC
jgi:hypothetical protein